jgi:hypothetical protein
LATTRAPAASKARISTTARDGAGKGPVTLPTTAGARAGDPAESALDARSAAAIATEGPTDIASR